MEEEEAGDLTLCSQLASMNSSPLQGKLCKNLKMEDDEVGEQHHVAGWL